MLQSKFTCCALLVTACAASNAVAASRGADFNGDGFDDLVVGVPAESFDEAHVVNDDGVVHVLYGGPAGLSVNGAQRWSQDSPGIEDQAEIHDRFGGAFAWGDFDGDGFDDLAIAASFEGLQGTSRDGVVHVLRGSPDGLTSELSQLWTQDSPGVSGTVLEDNHFGKMLSCGDFNGDGRDDLVIGAFRSGGIGPQGGHHGVFHVLHGTDAGLSADNEQFWHQDIDGIEGEAQLHDGWASNAVIGDFNGDGFDDLAVSGGGENFEPIKDAGAVNIMYGSAAGLSVDGSQYLHQGSPGMPDSIEAKDFFGGPLAAGDFNGDAIDDLAVGVWGEDSPSIKDYGLVHVVLGSADGLTTANTQIWHQDKSGIAGTREKYDHFGQALKTADFDGDALDDLAISVNESLGEVASAGAAHVLYGRVNGLGAAGSQFWTQNSPGIQGTSEAIDQFGSGFGSGDYNGDGFDDLAIGAWNEDVGPIDRAGVVHVLYGGVNGLKSAGSQLWHQNVPGLNDAAEEWDGFGGSL